MAVWLCLHRSALLVQDKEDDARRARQLKEAEAKDASKFDAAMQGVLMPPRLAQRLQPAGALPAVCECACAGVCVCTCVFVHVFVRVFVFV
jgi:hypothetical protein